MEWLWMGFFLFGLLGQMYFLYAPFRFRSFGFAPPWDEDARHYEQNRLWNGPVHKFVLIILGLVFLPQPILIQWYAGENSPFSNTFWDYLPYLLLIVVYPFCLIRVRNKDEWWRQDYPGRSLRKMDKKERRKIIGAFGIVLLLDIWILLVYSKVAPYAD